MTQNWPIRLSNGELVLRPLRVRDFRAWRTVRGRNQAWLKRWDSTSPHPDLDLVPSFTRSTKDLLKAAKSGQAMPLVLEYKGEFVGQINVSGITYGSLWSCHIGYWIDERVANKGLMTRALAMVCQHLFAERKLHRIEIAIRPENEPSNRVVQKLGFTFESVRKSFIHIDGQWRDHNIYVMFSDQISPELSNVLLGL